jgi:UPF0716 protein FxsA
MVPLLVLLFIVVPIVELAAILQVGSWIGFWPTLGLLVADSVLGSMLMRSQGRAAWRRFNQAVAAGRPPAREVIDGVLIIFGGALLLTPGFVTDLFGIVFLLPPTRALVRRMLVHRFSSRLVVSAFGAGRGGVPPRGPHPPHDVDGTATEVDQRHLP